MDSLPGAFRVQMSDLLSQAPVNVEAVAERLGLAIYERNLAQGVSGALVKDSSYNTPSGFVIFVDDSEAYVRQRFTAAHEIGHFVLHKKHVGNGIEDNFLLRSDSMSNAMEREANQFAADLLMPFPLVNQIIASGVRDLTSLARNLKVSEIAMGIRLGHPT